MYVWQTHLGTDAPFDTRYHTNPRTEIMSFIAEPPGTVLDIGCGGGATGRLVKDKFPGTRVVGIEINAGAAEHARGVLDRVVCAGVDDVDPARDMPDERISTVLLLDVLEHLYDPWRALQRIHGWLAPQTRVIASLPNIRNLATLSELAGGHFEYAENGVLDVTHVRFFTRASLRDLFEQTGFEVRRIAVIPDELQLIRGDLLIGTWLDPRIRRLALAVLLEALDQVAKPAAQHTPNARTAEESAQIA